MSDADDTLGGASSAPMSIPAAGSRWLLVRGRTTAIRLALPSFGALSIGSGADCDVRIDEPGVAKKHLLLQLDPQIAIEVLDGDSGAFGKSGAEKSLSPGAKIRAAAGDRLRAGSIELSFFAAASAPPQRGRRVWTRAFFERAMRSKTRGAVLRLRAPSTDAEPAWIEAAELTCALGPNEWALYASDAESASRIARGVAGAEVGLVDLAVDPKDRLLELAAERMTRLSPAGERSSKMIAEDPAMRELINLVEQVAPTFAHVLILGETGAGKDVVAQMIHDRSDRALRPMVRVNCVELADSFFDGDAAGAQRAIGGTLLLDEVGGLSLRAQLGLGHLLEKWSARGEVRVIATSNHDLREAVKNNTFRKDLYFRLNRVSMEIPALRERASEIVPLAEMFIHDAATALRRPKKVRLSKEARALLLEYSWPGNIRELKNVIERAVMVCGGELLEPAHLPAEVLEGESLDAPAPIESPTDAVPVPVRGEASRGEASREEPDAKPGSLRDEMASLERRRILEALDQYPTQTEAAKSLDIPLRTFLNRLDALGIARPRKK